MYFVLGIIVGLLIAIVTVTTLTFFRSQIEIQSKKIEAKIVNAGPRPQGKIYIPDDDATIARNEIIKKNREVGRDTPIDELM